MNGVVGRYVGVPVVFEELTHSPGARVTFRASGPYGSAIVKLYRSEQLLLMAARLRVLSSGPAEPEVPRVLAVDGDEQLIVLSDVRGTPLRTAILDADRDACRRAGEALGAWHGAWREQAPVLFRTYTIGEALDDLRESTRFASARIGTRVRASLAEVAGEWERVTVVHRNLHEGQLLLGERVGLVDLDDVAAGPPELDLGNLLAHLDLLELRAGRALASVGSALVDGYLARTPLDATLLDRCRRLARMRLACSESERRLLEPAPMPLMLAS